MFLATTGLPEFWDDTEEILFLGSWCMRQDRRSSWEKLRSRVLPSPWNDRKRFYEAAEYLDACGEGILLALTDKLNQLHGVQAPPRYWRVLVGPWLVHHLHVLYDRYIHLRSALDSNPDLKTIVLDPASFRVPRDGAEHIRLVLDDPYNLQLYSNLLAHMGYSFPTRRLNAAEAPDPVPSLPRRAAQWGWRRVQGMGLSLLRSRWEVALYETGLPRSAVWKMAWRTGFRAQPFGLEDRWPEIPAKPRFDFRRKSLSELPARDEFERLFVNMLPQDFPSLYLEGYGTARERARRALPGKPSVLLSGLGWHFHEPFKWVAAEAAFNKRRLVALQHGVGYGVYRFTSMERHEKRISDSFLVWGWGGENGGQLRNVPAPQLRRPRKGENGAAQETGPVLFVSTTNPLYFYRFYTNPQADQLQDYFDWQTRFLKALRPATRGKILFRPHLHPYPHGLEERLGRQFPEMAWDKGSSFSESLRRSSLAVIDHLGTPVLEALAADWPTLLYWDPLQWETRPEAQPYFDSLRQAGILWDSPEAAAAQLENLSGTARDWWNDPRSRKARKEFADRYARSRDDWAEVWHQVLNRETAEAAR